MGDGAADNEAAFERIENMSPFIFPLVANLGGVRVTAMDALPLLLGKYVNDVIVNLYAHYLKGHCSARRESARRACTPQLHVHADSGQKASGADIGRPQA